MMRVFIRITTPTKIITVPQIENFRQVNVYLSQLLWNFGKTNSIIRMERFYKLASEYEFLDSICNTIYDVKIHYYALLKAQSEVEIAKNNVYLNEDHLTKAHETLTKG